MPVTISYDLKVDDTNHRTYIRSMFERFYFRRLGGTVFRYDGGPINNDELPYEDWLNHISPAIMFFRSFIIRNNIELKFFTIDVSSVSLIDNSDSSLLYGNNPSIGDDLVLAIPKNSQSSEKTIRKFVDSCIDATK